MREATFFALLALRSRASAHTSGGPGAAGGATVAAARPRAARADTTRARVGWRPRVAAAARADARARPARPTRASMRRATAPAIAELATRPARGGTCKRGIATNTAPGAAFSPSVGWWYDWSPRVAGAGSPLEFVPMIWGAMDLTATLPPATHYLLGFNEPNFHAQSNLTAQQAAADWPMLEAKASASGRRARVAGGELLRPRDVVQRHQPLSVPARLLRRVRRLPGRSRRRALVQLRPSVAEGLPGAGRQPRGLRAVRQADLAHRVLVRRHEDRRGSGSVHARGDPVPGRTTRTSSATRGSARIRSPTPA